MTSVAGPSRLRERDKQSSMRSAAEPAGSGQSKQTSLSPGAGDEEEEDEEEIIDVKVIESFASKIQHQPLEEGEVARPMIIIPKRGEKDFEPLRETVNLQEMMLQRSREALFGALLGVRGGSSKSISHAILTPDVPFPRVLVTRGHVYETMGTSIKSQSLFGGKPRTHTVLLPEEALYLLERGSLQIWVGRQARTETEHVLGVGEWSDVEQGVRGGVEISVMEGFALFIGKEGLTWERYQAYAYLRRLGYTVHRTREFLPSYFLQDWEERKGASDTFLPPFQTWWRSLPSWIVRISSGMLNLSTQVVRAISQIGLALVSRLFPAPSMTLLAGWHGSTYSSLFQTLRMIPSGHSIPTSSSQSTPAAIFNPYRPFYHIWKPATVWSKTKWNRGDKDGLARQRPDYSAAVVDARSVPMPSLQQLEEIFNGLWDEPKGPTRKVGPQYERKPRALKPVTPVSDDAVTRATTWLQRLSDRFWTHPPSGPTEKSPNVPMGALRNGDRAFIVAVNDSGNTGWIRFGRTGFAEAVML